VVRNDAGETGFRVLVGGGLGRTPILGLKAREFLPEADLLPYVEAVLSVYNTLGRRDNKFKARIKITMREIGEDALRDMIETRFAELRPLFGGADRVLLDDIRAAFAPPVLRQAPTAAYEAVRRADPVFRSWADTNLPPIAHPDHAIVTISLKAHGETPGDATADQMRRVADLAERLGHGDIRVSHEQNVVLPHVHKADLPALHAALREAGLARRMSGCCPTSSPAPAWIIARWPPPGRSRSRRKSRCGCRPSRPMSGR
jgi:sulfite reductase (NADPH) hemoprotein beta-component